MKKVKKFKDVKVGEQIDLETSIKDVKSTKQMHQEMVQEFKKKDVRNIHNLKKPTEEITIGQSKTEPNQVIPLKTMLERLSSGGTARMFRNNFDGEEDYNEELASLQNMDKLEKVEYMKELQNSIDQQEAKIFEVQKRIKERKEYYKNAKKWHEKAQQEEAARIEALKNPPSPDGK